MNISRRNPATLRLALAIGWTLSGCQMGNWQQAGYGPAGIPSDAGQFPGSPPAGIDLGAPSDLSDSLDGSTLTDPGVFQSRRPETSPARANPSRDAPDSGIPGTIAGEPSTQRVPERLYVPPLRGPIRLGTATPVPFPEGQWRAPANPPVANADDDPASSPSTATSQPLPLTRKEEPRGSFDFPLSRPEDILNKSPARTSPNDGFDLPPLVKDDSGGHVDDKASEKGETGPALPALVAPQLTDAVPEFEVDVPPQILVGESTTITVRIAAPQEKSFSELKLIVTPGSGLVCSATADESSLSLDCPVLTSGQSHKMSFELQAISSGSHEFTVSLQSGEDELAWKKLNLTAQPRQLMTQLIGPEQKPINGRAEFTLKIENVSQQALGPIDAVLEFDSTLLPMEASAGAEQKPGQLVWSFPVLHPGELILLQAEYACPVESGSTLVSAYVSIEQGPAQVRQAAVAVKKAVGTLQVEVSDRNDLSAVDREMTGLVRVTNLGLQPARELQVTLDAPASLSISQITASVEGESVEIRQSNVEGKQIITLPSELPAEQAVEFEIGFTTLQAADDVLRVEVTAAGILQPVRASEPYTVTP